MRSISMGKVSATNSNTPSKARLDARSVWLIVAVCLSLVLGGCSSLPPVVLEPKDAAPPADQMTLARMARLPDPKVEALPKSRYGNKPVYTVLGKSYRVLPSAKGFKEEGLASWYGSKFHGRRTSSGEVFDTYALTAAHKHLPIPVFAKVTNLTNGKHTIVRINDRGPFHPDRVIDLSYAAAVKLGFHEHGTTRVRLEVVEPKTHRYMLQAGDFATFAQAADAQEELTRASNQTSVVVKEAGRFKLRLGPVAQDAAVERLKALLTAANIQPVHVLAVP